MAEINTGPKAALVTGGGTGIGAAIARRFAAAGYRVAVSGRRLEPIEAVARDIGGLAIGADVTDEASVADLMRRCEAAFGGLDVLVNNAGLGQTKNVPIEQIEITDVEAIFAANVRSVVLCIKHALPLLKRRRGAIVNNASMTALRPNHAGALAYSASKAAALSITKSVAMEAGAHGVRVNAVLPSTVETDLTRTSIAARMGGPDKIRAGFDNVARQSALGRIATADEVAEAVYFLASDAAGAISGTGLLVDAGRLYAP